MEEPRVDLDPDDELRMAAIVKRILAAGVSTEELKYLVVRLSTETALEAELERLTHLNN